MPGLVDCVLTYEELTAWLDEAGIQIEKEEAKDQAGRARSFPTCGGIIRSMDCKNRDYTYFAVDGIENCMRVLEDVTKGGGRGAFVEMSACAGSCVSGPILDKRHSLLLSDYQAVDRYTRPVDFDIPQPEPSGPVPRVYQPKAQILCARRNLHTGGAVQDREVQPRR